MPLLRRWRELSLLARFTITGLSLTLLCGLTLGFAIGRQLEATALRQEAEAAAGEVRLALNPLLRPDDFAGPLSAERYAQLDGLIRDRMLREHVVRIKIWDANRSVVYSDDPSMLGPVNGHNDELEEALEGEVASEISDSPKTENADQAPLGGRLMEVYVPIRLDGEQVIGVYEVYHDLAAVEPLVQELRQFLWLSLALGFGLLYLAQFHLVQRASRELRRAAAVEQAALRERELRYAAEAERRALHASETRFRSLVANASDAILIVGKEGGLQYLSPAVERIWGYRPEQLDGAGLETLVHPEDQATERELLDGALAEPAIVQAREMRLRRADGAWRDCEMVASNLIDVPGISGIVLTCHDLTERKSFERELRRLAFHDPLTGLPNRALFLDRLGQVLAAARRSRRRVAVLFLDLDGFKLVNDSLGHEAGDQLLIEVADRLRAAVRAMDTVARLGGDEFTVLLAEIGSPADAEGAAERILEAIQAPVDLHGQQVYVSASIGIAIGELDGPPADRLLHDADLAMYQAKTSGKARHAVFDQSMDTHAVERLRLEAELRYAIQKGELRVHFQPILSLADGRLAEVEALVRWQHPRRGLLAPDDFVPIAEETGLIVPVGRWVLEESCRHLQSWRDELPELTPLRLSVNLSSRQLQDPDVVAEINAILVRTGLDPRCLQLEISETAMLHATPGAVTALHQLSELGVGLAIDDFGTGYASLSYLKRLPVDRLKIDRSFIEGLGREASDTAIVHSVLAMGKSLDLAVISEGIETVEQLAQLRALGCELGQGYYLARPLPAEQLTARLRAMTWPGQEPEAGGAADAA